MTFHQTKQLILQQCSIKTDEDSFNDMVMKLVYGNEKANEKELIYQRIASLRRLGNSRAQTVCLVRYEFAKSERQAYRLIEESGHYDER